MSKTIAFVMDPMEGLHIEADTSFAFMLAASHRDARVFHVLPGDIMLRAGKVWLRGRYVQVRDKVGDHFSVVEESLICDLNNENKSLTKEELLKELKEKTISCKDVTFKILGLSLATINTIISLLFSIIILKIFLNYEKNK